MSPDGFFIPWKKKQGLKMLFTGCNFGAHVPNLSKAIILFLSLVFQVRVWNPTNINEVETNLQVQFLHQEHLSISKVS